MKQLWVRFDSGFQKLQSHLETHCSDHLGHSDPFRTPHVENTLKTTTMATLKTSGSKRKRQDWKGRTQWLSPLWVQSTCQQSLGVNWDFSKVWEPLRFQHWLENHQVCASAASHWQYALCIYSTVHPLSTELSSACRKLSKLRRL